MISHKDIFTIGIGGAAGDGVREAGQSIGGLLSILGYEVFISNTYPSLIRGGHNFTRISFSKEKVWCDHEKLDVLIALNQETVDLHKDELHAEEGHIHGIVFADSFSDEETNTLSQNAIEVPMLSSIKEINSSPITRNSVALGALCFLLDLDFEIMQKILAQVFANKQADINIKLFDIGYNHLKSLGIRHPKKIEKNSESKELVDGNTALGKGLILSGLNFYIGYPMTPTTGLLHFLASQKTKDELKVVQPENELAVINMALGISYAGKKVAIGSATGGFMLMQEAFSFAGMAELPLVIVVAQRQAPATGVPTYSSQTDLQNIIHAGHGEFPRVVLLPGDTEETFGMGNIALNLAWKYETPVIVLMDKILCEHSMTSNLDSSGFTLANGKIAQNTGVEYGRYEITSDGISPLAFPGTPNTVVKVTSYEHDTHGVTTEEALEVRNMIDKRFRKGETLASDMKGFETVKVYGHEDSQNVIVFWGSTKGAVLEAQKYFDKEWKLVQIVWAEPFDTERVFRELKNAKKIINIECNHDAQMGSLIREKTGIEVTKNILKYDSRPLDPIRLAIEINEI